MKKNQVYDTRSAVQLCHRPDCFCGDEMINSVFVIGWCE